MTDNQKGVLYLIPVPIDQNSKESILLEKYQKIVKDLGWQQPTSVANLMSRWNEIVGEEIASHVSIEIFNQDQNELILRADSNTWATQIRLLSSDLKRRIALEVGDGVVKTLKIYGPTKTTQKGLWRVPSMRKNDY